MWSPCCDGSLELEWRGMVQVVHLLVPLPRLPRRFAARRWHVLVDMVSKLVAVLVRPLGPFFVYPRTATIIALYLERLVLLDVAWRRHRAGQVLCFVSYFARGWPAIRSGRGFLLCGRGEARQRCSASASRCSDSKSKETNGLYQYISFGVWALLFRCLRRGVGPGEP